VVLFDITRPGHPQVLSVVNLGRGSGPPYLQLTRDESRLVVTDYFLVADLAPGGVVQADGDHQVPVLTVHPQRLARDPRFDRDCNRDSETGPARPHGVALLPATDD
jgi:hypothetical protein